MSTKLFVIHENAGSPREALGKLYCGSGQMNCFSPPLARNGFRHSTVFHDPAPCCGLSCSAEWRRKNKKRVGFGEYVRGGGRREEGEQEIEWGN